MTVTDFNQGLLAFLDASPTPFHAVTNMADLLEQNSFQKLNEADSWQLEPGQRYYTTRNGSSIIAFVYGKQDPVSSGLRILGAHTDSPCLKVKPNPLLKSASCLQLGVEVYGGALLNPWFDRNLSLAGRVSYRDSSGSLRQALINFDKAIGVIPSLAIHLDREANNSRSINAQKHLPVVFASQLENIDYRDLLLTELKKQNSGAEQVLDAEMFFYDVQKASMAGLNDDFITSARLDNLLSCYVSLQALIKAGDDFSAILVCNDHEEIGSASACGAQGPMLKDFINRLIVDDEQRFRCLHHSLMLSIDNAHALHPNYSDVHDANHGPRLNSGPVIKVNASQRYASNAETQSVFRHCANKAGVDVQDFVVRSDMGCGSTIGPITASELGVATVDIGIPQWGMHSIRETCGAKDPSLTASVLDVFLAEEKLRV